MLQHTAAHYSTRTSVPFVPIRANRIKSCREIPLFAVSVEYLLFPVIFTVNHLQWFDAAPTALYKIGQFTGHFEYKLACLGQPVFSGTRTKSQTCTPNVD